MMDAQKIQQLDKISFLEYHTRNITNFVLAEMLHYEQKSVGANKDTNTNNWNHLSNTIDKKIYNSLERIWESIRPRDDEELHQN